MFNGLLTKDFIVCLLKASFFLGCSFCDCLFFFHTANMSFSTETLSRSYMELRHWNEPTDFKHLTMFVQQYFIDNTCERTPLIWTAYILIYWDCVRNAGSQTRCCTTLYVARCFIVFLCAVCNKDKVSATLWRLNELLKCEAGVRCC